MRGRSGQLIFIALLVALIAWIARNTYWNEAEVPAPLQGEARTNPFYAAQRLAESLGARTQWRRYLGEMPASDAVIVLSSWQWSLSASRRIKLQRWVENGGRLVLDDSVRGDKDELERWSRVTREYADYDAEDEAQIALNKRLNSQECRPLELRPALPGRTHYTLCDLNSMSWLTTGPHPTWSLRDERGLQALRIGVGRGSLTFINAMLFGNQDLIREDHALLFVAASQLRRGDAVYFLSGRASASLLSLMWLYGAPAIVAALLCLILILWRGSLTFGPAAATPDATRRSLAEQIRGTGRFIARFGGGRALHAAALRALTEAAVRHVGNYSRLSSQERAALLARVAGLDEGALAEAMNYTGPRRPTELRNAVALLESARRTLSGGNRHTSY